MIIQWLRRRRMERRGCYQEHCPFCCRCKSCRAEFREWRSGLSAVANPINLTDEQVRAEAERFGQLWSAQRGAEGAPITEKEQVDG